MEGEKRIQNMGRNQLQRMLDWLCLFLDMPRDQVTGHVWRRSVATNLANSGMSLINLKRAGRWKSTQSCELYLEHSRKIKLDRMNRLTGSTGGEQDLIIRVSENR